MEMIPRLRAPENIRCIHAIKNQDRQNRINKPYHPVILFFSDMCVGIHPGKYNQFCQKQQNHQRQRLRVPAILFRYTSYLTGFHGYSDGVKDHL